MPTGPLIHTWNYGGFCADPWAPFLPARPISTLAGTDSSAKIYFGQRQR